MLTSLTARSKQPARALSLGIITCLGVLLAVQTWAAPKPAADAAPGLKKRDTRPAGELKAKYTPEPLRLPEKPWKIPEVPLDLSGRGISLYYLIPFDRVKHLLPDEFQPVPGPDAIWFRVDVLQWTRVFSSASATRPLKKFVELAYRFEVLRGTERGTYPLKLYTDSRWPVLMTRQYGGYSAYPVPEADVNFSPFIHFFQVRRGKHAILVVEAEPRQGVGAQVSDLFSRRKDTMLWQGEGLEFTLPGPGGGRPRKVPRALTAEIKPAEAKMLLLKEPVTWKILTREESLQPDKVLLLEAVDGSWLAAPDE